MGQKTHPTGNRLGFIKGWDSNWYGGKNYVDKIVEDDKIRKYLRARLVKASMSRVVIERTMKLVTVTIHTARPGVIIGKGGQEVDKLREELKKLTRKEIQINIYEIKRPELDARLVAESVARQLEARISYRRAVKMSIASSMRMGAEGIEDWHGRSSERCGNRPFRDLHGRPRAAAHLPCRHRLRTGRSAHHLWPHRRQGVGVPRRGLRKAGPQPGRSEQGREARPPWWWPWW